VLALTAEVPAGTLVPYNVASGTPHTIGEVAAAIAGDGPAPEVTGQYRLGDVRHVVASPQRAREELGFAAQVGFEDGMREFVTAPLRGDVVAGDVVAGDVVPGDVVPGDVVRAERA